MASTFAAIAAFAATAAPFFIVAMAISVLQDKIKQDEVIE